MPDYAVGPGRHAPRRGPVITAYVDTDALDRDCPKPPKGCGAGAGEFCRFPDGSERHMPCVTRCTPHHPPKKPGGSK